MDENKLYKSLTICVLVLASLSLCTFIQRIKVAGFELKVVDLFADVRSYPNDVLSGQSFQSDQTGILDLTYLPYFDGFTYYLAASGGLSRMLALPRFDINDVKKQNHLIIKLTDSKLVSLKSNPKLPVASALFEDFSPDGRSLEKFFVALNQIKQGGAKGRIAFFGDSFIEGDIFCGDVRNSLQDIFGGNGIGFVPITSDVAQFRNTIGHTFNGFHTTYVTTKDAGDVPFGAGGYCFTAGEDNELAYTANPNYKHLNQFHNIKLFCSSPEKTIFKYWSGSGVINEAKVEASDRLQQIAINNINSTMVSFNFPASDTIKLYGVSFEDSSGIYVDNFGLRGNSGLGLARISESMHQQFNQYQRYKLIILQYGLNIITPDSKDLNWYLNPMIKVVNMLKRCYPDASFLLMSVSDRSTKVDGQFMTMQSLPLMIETQREIARKTQIAFFNLFEAMGGENSMIGFVGNDPPLANKDYTHLNALGGRRVSQTLVKGLMNEYQNYNDQIKNHSSADSLVNISSN